MIKVFVTDCRIITLEELEIIGRGFLAASKDYIAGFPEEIAISGPAFGWLLEDLIEWAVEQIDPDAARRKAFDDIV